MGGTGSKLAQRWERCARACACHYESPSRAREKQFKNFEESRAQTP